MSERSVIQPALVLLALAASIAGCRQERYFGPYRLEVPTEIEERSAGRTFRLPLDESDRRDRDNLDWCLENEPERDVPCRCDFPVLTVDEQDLRIDYRLIHEGGQTVNASVWIGREVPPGDEAPGLVPDLPRVDALAVHLHRLQPGDSAGDSFTEEETRGADLAFSEDRFPGCEAEPPAPLWWLVGASITESSVEGENTGARVSLEITFRVRQGG